MIYTIIALVFSGLIVIFNAINYNRQKKLVASNNEQKLLAEEASQRDQERLQQVENNNRQLLENLKQLQEENKASQEALLKLKQAERQEKTTLQEFTKERAKTALEYYLAHIQRKFQFLDNLGLNAILQKKLKLEKSS
mgnify:CR=1 FL=1